MASQPSLLMASEPSLFFYLDLQRSKHLCKKTMTVLKMVRNEYMLYNKNLDIKCSVMMSLL
jgi:hypothetical protein